MTAPTVAPYRSPLPPARDGFPQLLHSEWTKARSVRRWSVTLLAAVVITVFVSLLSALSGSFDVNGSPPPPPKGPDGTPVTDSFPFVHQQLTGDGSITARVSPLTGREGHIAPWAKAGVIIKASTDAGSPYAAVMLTTGHGVRLQSDFTHDTPGSSASGTEPRWLRLSRSGSVLTASESADGKKWTEVGRATPAGLPRTVQAGLFAATPELVTVQRHFGSTSVGGGPSEVTASFDRITVEGDRGTADDGDRGAVVDGDQGTGTWRQDRVGADPTRAAGSPDRSAQTAGTWTLTGSGEIGPLTPDVDLTQRSLSGAQIGLIPLAALGVLFITTEYRRGLIRTTLTAGPRRGRMLAAKAFVLAGIAFLTGLLAAVLSFLLAEPALRNNRPNPGAYPEAALTDGPVLRAVLGTALLLAAVAVLALAVGALLRNTAAAVTLIVVVFVLPMVLLAGLPVGTAHWVMKVTPLAGFAVQQTTPRYDFVSTVCLPGDSCYPQGPWAGLAVLCAYAAVALGLAMWRLRRRDV
ncbi:ABC transporter permease subunit [Streptomyces sp. NPDC088246]|uniref:ABC transporter permease subunit n=1 Tax=Streptomyces sp. NPDC088246 TaxID=3365842 RepID=UPI0037FADA1F